MKWSAPLVTGSIGMRAGALHDVPSALRENTMSLLLQAWRKRQSCQATNTLPAPSISALGSTLVRRSPSTVWLGALATFTAFDQLAPPSVDTNAPMLPLSCS